MGVKVASGRRDDEAAARVHPAEVTADRQVELARLENIDQLARRIARYFAMQMGEGPVTFSGLPRFDRRERNSRSQLSEIF